METVKNFVVGSFGKVAGFVKGLGRPTKIGAAIGAGLVAAAGIAAHFLIRDDEPVEEAEETAAEEAEQAEEEAAEEKTVEESEN